LFASVAEELEDASSESSEAKKQMRQRACHFKGIQNLLLKNPENLKYRCHAVVSTIFQDLHLTLNIPS